MFEIIKEVIEANFTDIIIKTELPPRGTVSTEDLVEMFKKEVEEKLLDRDFRGKRVILSGPNVLSNSAFLSNVLLMRGAKEIVQEQADGNYIPVLSKEIFVKGYVPLQPGMRVRGDIEMFGRTLTDVEFTVLAVSVSRTAPFRYNIRDGSGSTTWVDSPKVKIKDIM